MKKKRNRIKKSIFVGSSYNFKKKSEDTLYDNTINIIFEKPKNNKDEKI